MSYWPWWLGAVALAAVSVGYRWIIGRTMGVSGALRTVLSPSEARNEASNEEVAMAPADALAALLAAATQAEFGAEASAADAREADAVSGPRPPTVRRPGWSTQGVFLLSLLLGGLLSSLFTGTFFSADFGTTFATLFGSGPAAGVVLFGGGLLVGFGTQMSGGCTSGHGLAGCARIQPASLLATVCFLGAGVLVACSLDWILT